MKHLSAAKVLLVAVGVVFFGYGIRMEDDRARWAGVISLVLAFLLRFAPRRNRASSETAE